MSIGAALLLALGGLLVGVGLTVLLLSRLSYGAEGSVDPLEQAMTFVGSGLPGTLGLLMIVAAVM